MKAENDILFPAFITAPVFLLRPRAGALEKAGLRSMLS